MTVFVKGVWWLQQLQQLQFSVGTVKVKMLPPSTAIHSLASMLAVLSAPSWGHADHHIDTIYIFSRNLVGSEISGAVLVPFLNRYLWKNVEKKCH